jgi:nucleoside-diphosphate-sugar epimerase
MNYPEVNGPETVLVAGCGYLGSKVAEELVRAGHQVVGVVRSKESAGELARLQIEVIVNDIANPAAAATFPSAKVVISCVSSGGGGEAGYQRAFLSGTENLLNSVKPDRFVFTSSTSVYGQDDGSLVDEGSQAEPGRVTGQILRAAESMVLAHGGAVARLGGIYGPGRCVPLRKLLAGEAIIGGMGERVMNQIHRDDAASAIRLIAIEGLSGVFNVVDDEPVTQLEWFTWVCRELGRELPPFGPRDLDRKRAWTSKRVSNRKLRSAGWELRYPTFREGVRALIADVA